MGEGAGSSGKRSRNKTMKKKVSFANTDNLDSENSDKKIKKVAKNKKRKTTEAEPTETIISFPPDDNNDKKKNKLNKKRREKENKKKDVNSSNEVQDDSDPQTDNLHGANSDKKVKKNLKKKKINEVIVSTTSDDVNEGKNSAGKNEKKKNKLKKKKNEKKKKNVVREHVPAQSNEVENDSNQQNGKSTNAVKIENDATLLDEEDEVYQISSGDEDETTGMKRWIAKYQRARPGPEALMENINEFLVDYRGQKDKEKTERENEAAEGGWTVVTHNKGRKKTTDAESGITVGSVAQAVVLDKMSKKKDKQVGLNFYRFQKREAQRNEIMTLQSKFEQDKKRIQQLRAERKFRPN